MANKTGYLVLMFGLIVCMLIFGCMAQNDKTSGPPKTEKEQVAVIQTNLGTMTFKFFFKDAPETCKNFIKLTNAGFYNDREFYRVVKGHVIQSGCEDDNAVTYTIKAEFNKNPHIIGAVGMARSSEPDSANTEFYICLAPRPHLDGKFTVFGQLIDGYDVLEKIGNIEVDEKIIEGIAFHRPKKAVKIIKLSVEERVK